MKAQIAPPVPQEDWSPQHTPVHGTPVLTEAGAVARIMRQTSETKNSSIDTLSKIEDLRKETKGDIGAIREDVVRAHDKIDGVLITVGTLQGTVGRSVGQNEEIIKTLDEIRLERKRGAEITTTETVSQIEVKTKRALTDLELDAEEKRAAIKDTSETRAVKRRLLETTAQRVIAAVATAIALLVGGAGLGRCSKEVAKDAEPPAARPAP